MRLEHAMPECADCGYELTECVCVACLEDTHGVTAAPDCDGCGAELSWWQNTGWVCLHCDELDDASDAEREP